MRLLCLLLCLAASAQVLTVRPAAPRWGQVLELIYDPAAEGATFTDREPVWLSARLYTDEGGWRDLRVRFEPADGVLRVQLPVARGSALLQGSVVGRGRFDPKGELLLTVAQPNGQPVRFAAQRQMPARMAQWERLWRLERELFPDNQAVWAEKWRWAAQFLTGEQVEALIRDDLPAVAGESAGALLSRCYGRFRLRQAEAAEGLLRQLAARFPAAWETAQGFEWCAGPGTGPGLLRGLAREHPAAVAVRQRLAQLADDHAVPLEDVERAAALWQEAEPGVVAPLQIRARARLFRQTRLALAVQDYQAAIDLLLTGDAVLFGDHGDREARRLLRDAYTELGEVHLLLGQPAAALAAAKAAQEFAGVRDTAPLQTEQQVWQAVGDPARAEAVAQAVRARAKLAAAQDGRLAAPVPTPRFAVAALSGGRINNESLRGRFVAINFWFTACPPCRKEIPELNKLVQEYSGRGVAFVAPALDEVRQLTPFLRDVPFLYEVVPNATALAEQFGVGSYPTHILLDREGRMVAVLTGEKVPELRLLLRELAGAATGQ